MSENPYTPPGAEVRDVDGLHAPASRPRAVVLAVYLLWISIVAGIPVSVREYQESVSEANADFLLAFTLALYAISVAITVFIHRGQNWARILLLVFNVLNLLSLVLAFDEFRKYPTSDLVAVLVVVALDLAALCLVYTRAGAAWFRPARRPSRP